MSVQARNRVVYYSPRRGRHFLTQLGAARAEANARLYRFFPSERADYDGHLLISPSWHFSAEPRLVEVRDRLVARYMRKLQP
jgi:hypothetical protein